MAQQVLESVKNRGKRVQNVEGKECWRKRTRRKSVKQHEKRMTRYQTNFERKRSPVVANVSIHHRKNKSDVKSTARLHKASQQITFYMKRSTRGRTAREEK